ncbi:MAG: uroporphyrinogen decarboxylase family protein [Parasporobacterium sp.]|nr:uroporphyrinogen decarboxylase family protein [Parasporobacterium sp.]
MKMNMYKWVEETIAAPKKKAMPVLTFPSIQKMGVTVKDLVNSADLQAEGIIKIAELTDAAAAVSYMDLSIEAEAFGSTINFSDDEVPTVTGSIVDDEDAADELEVPEVGAGRTSLNIEAIRKAAEKINDRPVFAGVIGPFSLAGRLLNVFETMYYIVDEPDMVHKVLEKTTEFLINYCKAYKEAGANGVVIAEPLAGLLSADPAEEFSAQYMRKIVEAVQDEEFLIVYHNCGNSAVHTVDTIKSNGCKVFHFGNAIDMRDLMPKMPSDVLVLGNIDPSGAFRNGTPEAIYEQTTKLMQDLCPQYPNFVISSGCDIPPLAPWENIDSFFKAVADYYK